jgi:hypothetical protein
MRGRFALYSEAHESRVGLERRPNRFWIESRRRQCAQAICRSDGIASFLGLRLSGCYIRETFSSFFADLALYIIRGPLRDLGEQVRPVLSE